MPKPASKKCYEVDVSRVVPATETVTDVLNKMGSGPDNRIPKLQALLDGDLGTAYFMAPSSARDEYHNCYAGGLAEHSLEVAKYAKQLAAALCPDKYTDAHLTFLAIVHDLGKAGDGKEEYFTFKDSDWHQKQGIKYEINEKCAAMSISDRTLYLLQKHGITLSPEELIALKLVEAKPEEVPDLYRYREPDLALIMNWANRWAIQRSNEK